jgi:hypothetical protein
MSTDRRIDLNVSVPDFGARNFEFGADGEHQRPLDQPDSGSQERFEQALSKKSPTEPVPPERVSPPNPFSIFGGVGTSAPDTKEAQWTADVSSRIGDSINRLMVDDGQHGNRQVRMELKDDVLPGVTVSIQELDGRLQVDFICTNEASRLRLNAAASVQARTLAERLHREVLLRVQTDDVDDACLVEAFGWP